MSNKKLPPYLRAALWSIPTDKLDLKKNKQYIINQLLSLGDLQMWRWLFATYPKSEVKKTFLNQPSKNYTDTRFYFIKNFLFNLKNKPLNRHRYVDYLPRDIRSA